MHSPVVMIESYYPSFFCVSKRWADDLFSNGGNVELL
jgi:hypothetical protein